MLGLIDSAMNKLEALENAEYIDQDGKDITPTSYDITFQMYPLVTINGLYCMM